MQNFLGTWIYFKHSVVLSMCILNSQSPLRPRALCTPRVASLSSVLFAHLNSCSLVHLYLFCPHHYADTIMNYIGAGGGRDPFSGSASP